jgi:probable HAF family extracellular repeat protein
MVTSVRWKWFLLPILGIALLAGGLVVHVEGGKPKPPAPPPVYYNIHFWGMPAAYTSFDIRKMNNLGQVVGFYITTAGELHGFLYDPWTDPDFAVDLNDVVTNIPSGMVIWKVCDINDNGVIVGVLQPATSGDPYIGEQGFLLDTVNSPTLLTLIPPPEDSSSSWAAECINNNGDILVLDMLTDPSYPVGYSHEYVYTLGTIDNGVYGPFHKYCNTAIDVE